MSTKTVNVVVIGNCMESGAGLRPGEGYLPIVQSALRQRFPAVDVRFSFETLVHTKYLPDAIDRALESGPDVVLLGSTSHVVRSATKINRLWATHGTALVAAHAVVVGIERRLASDGVLARAFVDARKVFEPLREHVPAYSIADYRTTLETAVRRLLHARCRVVLRGPVEVLRDGRTDVDAVIASVGDGFNVPYVITNDAMARDAADFQNESDSLKMNQAGHRLLAPAIESALFEQIRELLAARSAGEPAVLAQVRPSISALR